jgi:peptidoglycan/LPS O-acetylase OafA/YrhL
LLVVICHYVANADHASFGYWTRHFLSGLTVGWSGVDLFFVLSGFLIGGILLDNRESPRYFRTFYLRRVFRILPVYYLWILLYILITIIGVYGVPGLLPVGRQDLTAVPIYVLFLQNLIYSPSPFQWKWFVVTWSLAVEEQFYLLAPLAIRAISVRRLTLLLLTIVFAAPFLRLGIYTQFPSHSYLTGFAMPCRADALALGILVAIGWRREGFRQMLERRRTALGGTLAFAFLVVAMLSPTLVRPAGVITYTVGYSALAFFYTCLLATALSQKQSFVARLLRLKWLAYLGGISYCVYIIHLTINQFAFVLVLHSQPEINDVRGVGLTFLSLFITWLVAATSWRYLEAPSVSRGHRYVY